MRKNRLTAIILTAGLIVNMTASAGWAGEVNAPEEDGMTLVEETGGTDNLLEEEDAAAFLADNGADTAEAGSLFTEEETEEAPALLIEDEAGILQPGDVLDGFAAEEGSRLLSEEKEDKISLTEGGEAEDSLLSEGDAAEDLSLNEGDAAEDLSLNEGDAAEDLLLNEGDPAEDLSLNEGNAAEDLLLNEGDPAKASLLNEGDTAVDSSLPEGDEAEDPSLKEESETEELLLPEEAETEELLLTEEAPDASAPDAAMDLTGVCGEHLTWTFDSFTLTINGEGEMYDYSPDNPAPWHIWSDKIRKIVLNDGVQSIGDYAFCQEMMAATVAMPESLTRIGDFVFIDNYFRNSIELPASLQEMGEGYFTTWLEKGTFRCSPSVLTEKTGIFPETTTTISQLFVPSSAEWYDEWASWKNTGYWRDVIVNNWNFLQDRVESEGILDRGFCGENVRWTLKDDGTLIISGDGPMYDFAVDTSGYPITTIPWYKYKDAIQELVLEEGITYIGECAFADLHLGGISIPEGIKNIGDKAFTNTSFTSLELAEGLEKIGNAAFSGAVSRLDTLYVPSTVREIGTDGLAVGIDDIYFSGPAPTMYETPFVARNLYVPDDPSWRSEWNLRDDWIYRNSSVLGWYYNVGDNACGPKSTWKLSLGGELTIEGSGSVEAGWLGNYASKVTSIEIGKNITSIAEGTFADCQKLKTIILPENYPQSRLRNVFPVTETLQVIYFAYDGGMNGSSYLKDENTGEMLLFASDIQGGWKFNTEGLSRVNLDYLVKAKKLEVLVVDRFTMLERTNSGPEDYSFIPEVCEFSQAQIFCEMNQIPYTVTNRTYMLSTEKELRDVSFGFENSGTDFGYPDDYAIPLNVYQSVYGDSVLAQKLFQINPVWKGSCYGMAATALLLSQTGDNKCLDYELKRTGYVPGDGIAALKPEYQLAVSGGGIRTEQMRFSSLIERLHVSQYCDEIQSAYRRNMGKLNNVCRMSTLTEGFYEKPFAIAISGPDGRKAHVMLAYAMADEDDTYSRLFVYDPNFPKEKRYLRIRKTASGAYDGWEYMFNDEESWGSGNGNCWITGVPADTIIQVLGRMGSLDNRMSILSTTAANLKIYDGSGELAAEIAGGIFTSYSSLIQEGIIISGNEAEGQVHNIYLPAGGMYTIENPEDGPLDFSVISTGNSADIHTATGNVQIQVDDAAAIRAVEIPAGDGEAYDIGISLQNGENGIENTIINGTGSGKTVKIASEDGQMTLDRGDGKKEVVAGKKEEDAGKDNKDDKADPADGTNTSGKKTDPDPTSPAPGSSESGNEDKKKENETEAHVHQFGPWETTKEATVLKTGTKVRTCSCGVTETKKIAKKKAVLKLNAKKVKLQKGQTTTGLLVTMGYGDSIRKVTSSKPAVVKASIADAAGGAVRLKGKKIGKATVKILLASGKSTKVTVTVQKKKVAATKVVVDDGPLTLAKGDKQKAGISLKPFTAQDRLTYKSSNKKIVTVSKKGVITARKAGTATITVKAGKKKAVLYVCVVNRPLTAIDRMTSTEKQTLVDLLAALGDSKKTYTQLREFLKQE